MPSPKEPLTPERALAYLGELAPTEVREGVVLDAGGGRLAGPRSLAASAAELLRAALAAAPAEGAQVDAIEVAADRGVVFAARSSRYALAVVAERSALPSLMLYDLRRVLAGLEADAA